MGTIYTDGSRIDGDVEFEGHCARLGWAFVAVDDAGCVVAAASGRTPDWVLTIFGAELWALWMALIVAVPGSGIRTDCQSVQTGTLRGAAWASSPKQRYSRLWSSVLAALDDSASDRVLWMPAHTAEHHIGTLLLSSGQLLTAVDRYANGHADRLAKAAAGLERVPQLLRSRLQQSAGEIVDMGIWLGMVTAYANAFAMPDGTTMRDSMANARHRQGIRRSVRSATATVSHTAHSSAARSVAATIAADAADKRCTSGRGPQEHVTGASQSLAMLRRRQVHHLAEREAAMEEARFQRVWRDRLQLATDALATTAAEKVAAIRQRVLARARLYFFCFFYVVLVI
jgi:hypothetical protein